MRILLINQNPIVSKLAGLSAQKSGYEIVEEFSLDEIEGEGFDVLFIDDAKLEGSNPEILKRRTGVKKTCLIYADDENKAPGFDYYIKKPFLPTEMVDLMSEIHDDLLLPEMETESAEEEQDVPEMPEKELLEELGAEFGEEMPQTKEEKKAEIVGMEDFDTLLEELEAESHEEEKASSTKEAEEDFEALMASLEAGEESETQEAPAGTEERFSETAEETPPVHGEAEETETEEAFDLDKLLEEAEASGETTPEESLEEEDFEALLEGLDLGEAPQSASERIAETERESEEKEPVSLPEPEEPVGGILDESLVSEVKELLGEETVEEASAEEFVEALPEEREKKEEAETFDLDELLEEVEAEGEEIPAEEETMPVSEASELPSEESVEEISLEEIEELEVLKGLEPESEEELETLSEEELGAVLGEEIASEEEEKEEIEETEALRNPQPETAAEEAPKAAQAAAAAEGALLSGLLGSDPEALRKLLAGAQITINITFPKDA